jgi:hypothetical protein
VAARAAGTIALAWQTRLALVAIATNSRAVRQPSSVATACCVVGS